MDNQHLDVDRCAAYAHGLYDHKHVYVESEDALLRGNIAGFNVRIRRDEVYLHPRISRTDFQELQDVSLKVADDVMSDLLAMMEGLSPEVKGRYMVDRKAVWKPMKCGGHRMVLVPRVPVAVDDIDVIQGMPIEEALKLHDIVPVSISELRARPHRRIYQLTQIFNDKSLLDKYDISRRQLEAAKRLAATDASAAARMLQEAMNFCQDDVWVKIKAQAWTKSKKQAVNTINMFCRDYPYVETPCNIEMVGSVIYMYGPQGEDWLVSGPVALAEQVRALHALVAREGYIFPSILLSVECVLLNINLGTNYDLSEPILQYHAGTVPVTIKGVAEQTARAIPTSHRAALEKLRDKLLPVTDEMGDVIATSVRVTDSLVLVNNHVVADTEKKVCVDSSPVSLVTQVSRDVWAANSNGLCDAWQMRNPVVGEQVVLCGVGVNGMYVSAPIRILSVNDTCIVLDRNSAVVQGMSGAAVVALRDLALLGIHSAATAMNLIAYRFGPKELSVLVFRDSSIPESLKDGSVGDKVMTHFRSKGIVSILKRGVTSVRPLYKDYKHFGMAVATSSKTLVTVLNVDDPLYVGNDAFPLQWSTLSLGVFSATYKGDSRLDPPPIIRSPKVLERVFLVGFNMEPYIIAESVISYVGLDAKSFNIRGFDFNCVVQGALVMGWDGSAIGLLASDDYTIKSGGTVRCWTFPTIAPAVAKESPEVIEDKFPFLNTQAWPTGLCDQVFIPGSESGEHSSEGNSGLAEIGRRIVSGYIVKDLWRQKIPYDGWTPIISGATGDRRLSKLSRNFDLPNHRLLSSVGCSTLTLADDADILWAIIGAASVVETPETLDMLMDSLGFLKFNLTDDT